MVTNQILETQPEQRQEREDDAEEAASFLLTLKHRSVTPEPLYSASPSRDSNNSNNYNGNDNKPSKPLSLTNQIQERELQVPNPIVGAVYGLPTTGVSSRGFDSVPTLLKEPPTITDEGWQKLRGDSTLVSMKDRELIPDSLFVAMSQMQPCQLTQADRVGCYKTREIGFVGMCCKHCGGQPGFGRFFPNSVRSLAQTTTSQTIVKHVNKKCRSCPPEIRQTLLGLQRVQAAKEGQSTGPRPRYGSRKIFFQLLWSRLHENGLSEDDDDRSVVKQTVHVEENSLVSTLPEDHSNSSTASLSHESEDDLSLENVKYENGFWEHRPPMKKRKIVYADGESGPFRRVVGV